MSAYSRRKFLAALAAGLGAASLGPLLSACGIAAPAPTRAAAKAGGTSQPAASQSQRPTAAGVQATPTSGAPQPGPTAAAPEPSPTAAASYPHLVVARHGEPETLVQRTLAALGGIERFVRPGARVVVKPNLCVAYHSYEYAATTNPWVVGALVKLCLGAGAASVRVMDTPFGGTSQQAYAVSGVEEQVKAAGGEMVVMSMMRYIDTELPRGLVRKHIDIYDEVLDADVLINVPIAKHHSLAKLTLGMKNLMGVVTNRESVHPQLGQQLADLNSRVVSTFTVIDAVRILMDHGPTGGSLDDVRQLDTLIASPDIVAADSYAATLFGLLPADLDFVQAGTDMGLGRSDLANLKIEEIDVGA